MVFVAQMLSLQENVMKEYKRNGATFHGHTCFGEKAEDHYKAKVLVQYIPRNLHVLAK
jgi:hypothetical protein